MFYTLVDARGIRYVVTTETSSYVPSLALVLSHDPAETTLVHVLKVDHLAGAMTILTVEDSPSPLTSTKWARVEEPQSPWIECLTK